ncbi:DUF2493 domain-containing protein, partial [bacterium]|nr:DUF2493 domain-containing protein [bacterium]
MRVLVCGGRKFDDKAMLERALGEIEITELIEGAAKGADRLAREWAEARKIPFQTFKPEFGRYGRAAGPIRNKRMLAEGKPDLVVAFPGGSGTANMVGLARAAGVPVRLVA